MPAGIAARRHAVLHASRIKQSQRRIMAWLTGTRPLRHFRPRVELRTRALLRLHCRQFLTCTMVSGSMLPMRSC